MNNHDEGNLGSIIKRQRISVPLTLQELTAKSGVSASHLGRIERGERFPSARILRRIARPLGFEEDELLILAGYLSPRPPGAAEPRSDYIDGRLDPHVVGVLAKEPVDVQRAVVSILTILKSFARSINKGSR